MSTLPADPSTPEPQVPSTVYVSRLFIGLLIAAVVLVPVIGQHLLTRRGASEKPQNLTDVFPIPLKETEWCGVLGAWSEGLAPTSKDDKARIDPNQALVVRVLDLDGWVLRRLAARGVQVKSLIDDPRDAESLQKWAEQRLEQARQRKQGFTQAPPAPPVTAPSAGAGPVAAPAVTATSEVSDSVQQERFNKLFLKIRSLLELNMDGVVIKGARPANYSESRVTEAHSPGRPDRVDDFIFRIDTGSDTQKEVFRKLARGNGLTQKVLLSLSFESKDPNGGSVVLPSALSPSASDELNLPIASQQPVITFAPDWKIAFVVLYGITLLVLLTSLGYHTNILRALDSRRRPNGRLQLSLSHFQLAIWFITVFGSYIYLWVITGDLHTMSNDALYLVGIAIVTSLGAGMVQQSSSDDDKKAIKQYNRVLATREGTMRHDAVRKRVAEEYKRAADRLKEARNRLIEARKDAGADTEAGKEAKLAPFINEESEAFRDAEDLRHQKMYVDSPWHYRWLIDLLSENGEVTLHRFQMLAWTFGLAFIFCVKVFADLTMPTFPGQVLALMGISAGTYIGFRIPEMKKITDSLASSGALSPPASPNAQTKP